MKIVTSVLGAAAVLAAMLSLNTSATAEPATLAAWDCPPATVCLYNGNSGTGAVVSVEPTCTGVNLGLRGRNDEANSLRNRTSRTAYFYSYISNDRWEFITSLGSGGQKTLPTVDRNRIDLVASCRQ